MLGYGLDKPISGQIRWIDASHDRPDVARLLSDRRRIAQEAVGHELLSRQPELLMSLAANSATL